MSTTIEPLPPVGDLSVVPETEEEKAALSAEEIEQAVPVSLPQFLLNSDIVTSEVFVYKRPNSDHLRMITFESAIKPDDKEKEKSVLKRCEYIFTSTFSLPSKPRLEQYREHALVWSPTLGRSVIKPSRVRMMLVKYHLKKLEIKDPQGNVTAFPLEHDKKGALTKTAWTRLMSLHPTIVEFLSLSYENQTFLLVT